MFGIVLIQKDIGRTSHDVVDAVRRRFNTRRVGHAGTLDPLASGLLVVAVGPATRFLQYLPLEPKEYLAEITFGRATSTYDAEGETTFEAPIPDELATLVSEKLTQFRGLISQLPPMHSAVKKDGKPLYHYARQGKEIEREPRNVHIETFDVEFVSTGVANARIICSGGTYIRSLAHDLGAAIGCGAHLTKLHRSQVGRFADSMAAPVSEATPDMILPLREALKPMPMIPLNEIQVAHIREGRQIGVEKMPPANVVALLDVQGEVFSIARLHGNLLQPECVIPVEAFHAVS